MPIIGMHQKSLCENFNLARQTGLEINLFFNKMAAGEKTKIFYSQLYPNQFLYRSYVLNIIR